MRYIILAKHWDEARQEITEYAAGMFPSIATARMFQAAYEAEYHTTTRLYDIEQAMTV